MVRGIGFGLLPERINAANTDADDQDGEPEGK